MSLPADTHVHSEYSWDTGGPMSPRAAGTMERTCARAVQIGMPALVFTEHLDFTGWTAAPEDFLEHLRPSSTSQPEHQEDSTLRRTVTSTVGP